MINLFENYKQLIMITNFLIKFNEIIINLYVLS